MNKQAVGGFRLQNAVVKKAGKGEGATEKLRIVLEVELADLTAGEYGAGDVIQSLLNHMTGDSEVGLTLFVNAK